MVLDVLILYVTIFVTTHVFMSYPSSGERKGLAKESTPKPDEQMKTMSPRQWVVFFYLKPHKDICWICLCTISLSRCDFDSTQYLTAQNIAITIRLVTILGKRVYESRKIIPHTTG